MADLIAGKYERLTKIGVGGMGTVWKVRHIHLDTVYALKELPDTSAGNPELVARFQREARIMAQLRHDNIVRVFDITHENDVHGIVMELVDGPTLAQHMRARGLQDPLEALDIARQVGRALAYAHSRGVVHRDVKPSNVLLESTTPLRALLSDFGIAKVDDAGERTRTGSLLGTLRYGAPEQLSGEDVAKIDARADIFALGLVIYEMFEGKPFHANRGEAEIYRRVLYDPAPLTPGFSRPVPPGLEALVRRAIQRDPAERFPNTADMLKALDRCVAALSDDDGGKTIVISRSALKEAQEDATHDDVSDDELDQRIRALEVERQRRLVQSSRARVDAARERARAARGPELATTAFEQAAAHETEASAALDRSQYMQARDLLEKAASLFEEAETAAAAARRKQEADAARVAMRAARTDAEEAHAEGEARTLYARALALEAEAEAHLGRESYPDAQRGYAEAERLYAEARDEVRQRRRQLAERERGAMAEARRLAEAAGAAEHAPEPFRRATARVDEAAAAAKRDDWDTARALLEDAGRTFGEAAREAVARRAAAERGTMLAAKEAAESAGARANAAAPWVQAAASEAQGERHLAGSAYTEAERAFVDARRLYAESEALAERIQREAADRALADVEAARERAESVGADNLASELYRRATAEAEQADKAVEEEDYSKGRELLEEATRLFTKASLEAEIAGHADAAAQARAAMDAAKRHAAREGAPVEAGGKAAALEAEALAHLGRGVFADAERIFGAARDAYEQDGKSARAARRTTAERARSDMQASRQAATTAGAERHVPAVFRAAQADETRAQASFEDGEFASAAECFASAGNAYARAAAEAREAVRRDTEAADAKATLAARDESDDATRRLPAGNVDATRLVSRRSVAPTAPPGGDDATVLQRQVDDATRLVAPQDTDATRLLPRRSEAPPALPSTAEDAGAVEPTVYQAAGTLRTGVARQTRLEPVAERPRAVPLGPKTASRLPLYAALAAAALAGLVVVYLVAIRKTPEDLHVPPPLAWTRTVPAEEEAALLPGKSVRFVAEVADASARKDVRYAWLVDGQERAQGTSWEYTPKAEDAGTTREVKVVASVGTERIEHLWRVRIGGANRPPVIAAVSPPGESVTLDAGAEPLFTVTARDPDEGDELTYVWERNGRPAAEGQAPSWTLHEAVDGDQIRVTVRDQAGLTAGSQTWRVALTKPPPAPMVVPADTPPRILGETPPAQRLVSVAEGATIDFSLRVDDAGKGSPLSYVWFLDGREVGRKSTWQFKAPSATAAKTPHKVEAEVAGDGGRKAPRVAWNVEVTWAPPRIVDYSPRERRVVVEPGKPTRFTVAARTGDGQPAPTYEWVLDNDVTQRTREGRFEVPGSLAPGEHALQLTSLDGRGLRSAPQRWTLEVSKPAAATARLEAPPSAPEPPPRTTIERLTETEVRDWLGRYKAAWESRQVEALQRIGVVTAAQADAVRKALASYKNLQVAVSNEKITLQGQQATVSFDRSDTDETGKPRTHPTQTWRLEKGASGVVAIGKAP